jgi:hypothetical protein
MLIKVSSAKFGVLVWGVGFTVKRGIKFVTEIVSGAQILIRLGSAWGVWIMVARSGFRV